MQMQHSSYNSPTRQLNHMSLVRHGTLVPRRNTAVLLSFARVLATVEHGMYLC